MLQKSTKTAVETGSTFCTILSDVEFRLALHEAKTEEEFRNLIRNRTQDLIKDHGRPENRKSHLKLPPSVFEESENEVTYIELSIMVHNIEQKMSTTYKNIMPNVVVMFKKKTLLTVNL